jgi:hypothetical protein
VRARAAAALIRQTLGDRRRRLAGSRQCSAATVRLLECGYRRAAIGVQLLDPVRTGAPARLVPPHDFSLPPHSPFVSVCIVLAGLRHIFMPGTRLGSDK